MLQWLKIKGVWVADYKGVDFSISKPKDMLCFTLYINGKKIVSRAEVWQLQDYALQMIGGEVTERE